MVNNTSLGNIHDHLTTNTCVKVSKQKLNNIIDFLILLCIAMLPRIVNYSKIASDNTFTNESLSFWQNVLIGRFEINVLQASYVVTVIRLFLTTVVLLRYLFYVKKKLNKYSFTVMHSLNLIKNV